VSPGDSVVIAPGGEVVSEPMGQEQGILYADVGLEPVAIALRRLDVVGHYERPGIFHFRIDRGPMRPVVFEGA
jgi:nitrilase